MTDYLSFEWLKVSRRWMPRVILLLLAALTVIVFLGQASRLEGRPNLFLPRGWLAALEFSAFFAPFFWPVLGGSWAGNEYGWGTIRTILTRRPSRVSHVLAALAVLIAAVFIGLVVIMIVGTGASIVVTLATGNSVFTSGLFTGAFAGAMFKGFLTAWYVSSFYLLIAYAAATIFRSAAVGIGLGIGATLAQIVLTQLLGALGGIWNDIALQFPFHYSEEMITQVVGPYLVAGTNLARVSGNAPSAGQSLVALTIYGAAAIAIMLAAVRFRDVTA
jgi:ABC-2 type transport system permease protein